jgi:6-pyruvoyltetrahydropterin/6-carboxytetrahydropterin synthase
MPSISVTRRYRFSASHRLHSPLLGDDENRRVYGKCNHPFGHGHDYILDVTLSGPLDPSTGRLVPLTFVDTVVRESVLRDVAWRNLNVEVEEFLALVPTTENLASVIATRLEAAWRAAFPGSSVSIEKVRIQETRNNIFEASCRPPQGHSSGSPGVLEKQETR